MKVVYQLDCERIVRRDADAARVRQSRENQDLGIQLSEIEAGQMILRPHNGLYILVRRLIGRRIKRLASVYSAAQPAEVVIRRPYQVTSITATKCCAQVQILLAAMKKIG